MAIEADIADALLERAEALATSLGLVADMPNIVFEPPAGLAGWLEVRHMPNDVGNYAWGNEAAVHRGILQIAYVSQAQTGIITPLGICDQIAAYFPKGGEYRSGVAVVQIEQKPSVLGVLVDGQKSTYPVSIRYRCSI